MTEFLNDWGLILTIFLPLVGALVMMAVPKESEGTIKAVALGTSLLAALVGILLLVDFDDCVDDCIDQSTDCNDDADIEAALDIRDECTNESCNQIGVCSVEAWFECVI